MHRKNRTGWLLRQSWLPMALLALLSVVSGCGGGGGGGGAGAPPVVNLDPTGYYSNTGTLTLTPPALPITDMQAMIYNNRFIMVSKERGFYYDGPITVSGNTITSGLVGTIGTTDSLVQFGAPGHINTIAALNIIATLNATINPDRSISGTVVHNFDGISNPFTLQYATGRSDSTVDAIANTQTNPTNPGWSGTLYNLTTDTLTFNLANNLAGSAVMSTITKLAGTATNFQNCVFTGTLIPINGTSLYEASIIASSCSASPEGFTNPSGTYTGFAALRATATLNDTLVIAVNFDTPDRDYAVFGEFQ